jgi:hypothetical protein
MSNFGYSGKIPPGALMALEHELAGITHGVVSIGFHIRDGRLARFETDKHLTYIPNDSAGGLDDKEK